MSMTLHIFGQPVGRQSEFVDLNQFAPVLASALARNDGHTVIGRFHGNGDWIDIERGTRHPFALSHPTRGDLGEYERVGELIGAARSMLGLPVTPTAKTSRKKSIGPKRDIPLLVDEYDARQIYVFLSHVPQRKTPEGVSIMVSLKELETVANKIEENRDPDVSADAMLARDLLDLLADEKARRKKPKTTRPQKMGQRMARAGSRGTGAALGERENNPTNGTRKGNPLPDPANIIASAAIGAVTRHVMSRVLNGGEAEPDNVREENPVSKKSKLYTDHRGLAFYLTPTGREMWRIDAANGLRSAVSGILGHVERRGDGILYVAIPAVGQWWKPTGKNVLAAANYILSESDAIFEGHASDRAAELAATKGRGKNPRAKSKVPPLTQWHTFAGNNFRWYARNDATADRPSDFHYFDLGPSTDARGRARGWQVMEWDSHNGGHKPARYFGTRNEALRYVRESMEGKRASNPTTVGSTVRNVSHVILQANNRSTGQRGFWTGTGWDTDRKQARKISALGGLAEALKMAQKLANAMPNGWHIQVLDAGK